MDIPQIFFEEIFQKTFAYHETKANEFRKAEYQFE